jgi:hypothetical protein
VPSPTEGEFSVLLGLSLVVVSGFSVVAEEQAIMRGAIATDIKPSFESVDSFIFESVDSFIIVILKEGQSISKGLKRGAKI